MATNPRIPGAAFRAPLGPIRLPSGVLLLALLPLIAVAGVIYWWGVQRVEVGPDELCVLVRKVGDALPQQAEGQVILYPALLKQLNATGMTGGYKGIVHEPLQPGRYFYDPFFWERVKIAGTEIKQNEVGVLIRKFGKPLGAGALEGGKTIADRDDERGPVREVLKPGRHPINTLAYDVKKFAPIAIEAGWVGVQTLYAGTKPENPNVYVVKTGESGVQPDVLPPGLYYNNPFEKEITPFEVRSHVLDLREAGAIEFPSNDSFTIHIEASVEYAILPEKAPYILVAIGDHGQVVNRIILPYMNSLARIEGSKLDARDFIAGETRVAFQNKVLDQLRRNCLDQGIEIRAALIRRIVVPEAISGPISQRQDAQQNLNAAIEEIKEAHSQARYAEQQEMKNQNQALGETEQKVVAKIKQAEQDKNVALTLARQRLEVAKLHVKEAEATAAAKVSIGRAEAANKLLGYEAQARPLADSIAAFGDGDSYAQYFFYQKLAPALKNVMDSTDGPLAEIFRSLGPARPLDATKLRKPENAKSKDAPDSTGVSAVKEGD